jgi:hypothetical protein
MKEYVLATKAYPWLLPIVEESLRGVDDGDLSHSEIGMHEHLDGMIVHLVHIGAD